MVGQPWNSARICELESFDRLRLCAFSYLGRAAVTRLGSNCKASVKKKVLTALSMITQATSGISMAANFIPGLKFCQFPRLDVGDYSRHFSAVGRHSMRQPARASLRKRGWCSHGDRFRRGHRNETGPGCRRYCERNIYPRAQERRFYDGLRCGCGVYGLRGFMNTPPERQRNVPAGILFLSIFVYSTVRIIQSRPSATFLIVGYFGIAIFIGVIYLLTRNSGSGGRCLAPPPGRQLAS